MSDFRYQIFLKMNFQLLTFNPAPFGHGMSLSFHFQLNYKDHLGNNRLSYTFDPKTEQVKILEENHYYPFGLKHGNYNQTRKDVKYQELALSKKEVKQVVPEAVKFKYLYNGKELQDELGLNLYSMDMRQYDPAIARWTSIDPVVHFDYSMYLAFDNNPVFWADPSGADSEGGERCYTCDVFGRQTIENGRYITVLERQQRAKAEQNGTIDKIAVAALKETARIFFYVDGKDFSDLSEADKQKVFKTDELGTIGILLWEFATGTGKEIRKFDVGIHPFADRLIEGRILGEIVKEFNDKLKARGYDFSKLENTGTVNVALEFSPNKNPSSWLESLIKHVNSNPTQFFVGGAIAKVKIQNKNLMIQIYNETSRNSLMLHIGKNYDRRNGNKPLSTIKQYVNAKYRIK